ITPGAPSPPRGISWHAAGSVHIVNFPASRAGPVVTVSPGFSTNAVFSNAPDMTCSVTGTLRWDVTVSGWPMWTLAQCGSNQTHVRSLRYTWFEGPAGAA